MMANQLSSFLAGICNYHSRDMASYAILITNDGGGTNTFSTISAKKNSTAITGGTALTLPSQDGGVHNSLHEAQPIGIRAANNSISTTPATGDVNMAFLFVDNGSGGYTTSVKYGATSIDGTALTLPTYTQTTGLALRTAYLRAFRACLNDRSTNG